MIQCTYDIFWYSTLRLYLHNHIHLYYIEHCPLKIPTESLVQSSSSACQIIFFAFSHRLILWKLALPKKNLHRQRVLSKLYTFLISALRGFMNIACKSIHFNFQEVCLCNSSHLLFVEHFLVVSAFLICTLLLFLEPVLVRLGWEQCQQKLMNVLADKMRKLV